MDRPTQHRLIEPITQDSSDIPLTTHLLSPESKAIVGVLLTTILVLVFFVSIGTSQAFDSEHELNDSMNSQRIALLKPSFGIEVPKAIGGPDAPFIEDGTLHPFVGLTSNAATQVEQDKNGISYYIVQKADTISEIAELFNVSSNTIVWENKLGKSIKTGQELRILPVTGIRHNIKKGDTLGKIAETYEVEKEDITVYNGIDESKLVIGEVIIVPNGAKQKVVKTSRQ